MKLKNRNGTALFTLVMFFSVLILMSTGVLALTNMAAQSRALERRRKIALYESEISFNYVDEELQRAFLDPTNGIYVTSLQDANTAAGEYTELLRLLLQRKWDMAESKRLSSGAEPDVTEMEDFDAELLASLDEAAYNRGKASTDIYSLDYHLFQYLSKANGGEAVGTALTAQLKELTEDLLPPELTASTLLIYTDGGAVNLTTEAGINNFMNSRGKFEAVEARVQEKAEDLYIASFNTRANEYVNGTLADTTTLATGYNKLETRLNILSGISGPAADFPDRTAISLDTTAAVSNFSAPDSSDPVDTVPLTFISDKPSGDDGRRVSITADYEIRRPDFQSQGLYTILGNVDVNENILQQKAIAAKVGITVKDSVSANPALINGAIFSGGDLTLEGGAELNLSLPGTDVYDAYVGTSINMGNDTKLEISGAGLRAGEDVGVGMALGGGAEFTISGGDVHLGGAIDLGSGSTFTAQSGTVTAGAEIAGAGVILRDNSSLNMANGTLLANGAVKLIGEPAGGTKLNMENGRLYSGGDITLGNGTAVNMPGTKSLLTAEGDIVNAGNRTVFNFNGSSGEISDIADPPPTSPVPGLYITGSIESKEGHTDAAYNIAGNVFTGRNIILDGDNSHIKIDGDYYGYSSGGTGSYNTGSRIAVNAIGVGSTLEIDAEHVLIAGTAYVEGLAQATDGLPPLETNGGMALYQTGESVAIKGNYAAYGFPITSVDPSNKNYYKNINFRKFATLYAAYSFTDSDDVQMTGMEKAVYFLAAAEEYKALKNPNPPNPVNSEIFAGELINTDIVKITTPNTADIITNGAYIAGQNLVRGNSAFETVQNAAGYAKTRAEHAIDWYKNLIAALPADSAENPLSAHGFAAPSSLSEDDSTANQNRYRAYVSENKIIFAGGAGTVTILPGSSAGITKSGDDYTITVNGGYASIALVNGGDVIIEDGLTLVGSIISNGRITLGSSRLYANKDRVVELLALDKFDNITGRRAVGDRDNNSIEGPIANEFDITAGAQTKQDVYRRVGVDSYYRPPDMEKIIRLIAWE